MTTNKNGRTHFILLTLLFTALTFYNLVTLTSAVNVVLTVLEIFVVFYLIFKNKLSDAVIWHFIFILTCISANSADEVEGLDSSLMFSYSRLKLIGPIGVSYLISIVLLVLSKGKKSKMPKDFLFSKLYRFFCYVCGAGIFVGIIGILISDYYVSSFLSYSIYMIMVLVNMCCLLKHYSEVFEKKILNLLVPLLCGASFAAFLAYLSGVRTNYGGIYGVPLMPDITYYGAILLLVLLKKKHKLVMFLALVCFVVLSVLGMTGKAIFINVFAVLIFVLQIFASNMIRFRYKLIGVIVIVAGAFYFSHLELGQLSAVKLAQAVSIFDNSGDLDMVAGSPKVRIASTINVYHEGVSNPFFFLFGHGYGGYFKDDLKLMEGMDLTNGGWPEEIVRKGKFPSAHDTFATVPLLSGFVSLFLLLFIGFKYIGRVNKSAFAYAAFPWLILTFYFNIQTAIAGMLFLFAADYEYSQYEIKKET